MKSNHLKKIDYHIAIWGLIGIALALAIGGFSPALSALIGAVLGMGNWLVFRYLIRGIAASGDSMGLFLFLGVKSVVLLGVVTLLIALTPVQPIPFLVGISALFLGISSYYFTHLVQKGRSALGGDN